MDNELIIMRGYQGSGKSTEARRIRDAHDGRTVIISPDDMRTMLTGGRVAFHNGFRDLNTIIFQTVHEMTASLLTDGVNVIIDAMNVNPHDCMDFIRIADTVGRPVRIVDCTATIDELLRRNRERPHDERIPEKVITANHHRWRSFRPSVDELRAGLNGGNLLYSMMESGNVNVRETEPGIYACNFTRNAFRNHDWDSLSSIARGLFLDADGNVVSRGFDKFFSIGENEETTLNAIRSRMVYPAVVETKQNGFLGLVSARDDGSLRYYSKGGLTDYSRLIRRVFEATATRCGVSLDDIASVLSRHGVTLACEIIDVESDRHIIGYDGSTAYALHCIRNQRGFEIDHDADGELAALGYDEWTPRTIVDDYDGLIKALRGIGMTELEGAVVYSADGYMFKYKTQYYLGLKSLRNMASRLMRNGHSLDSDASDRAMAVRTAFHELGDGMFYTRTELGDVEPDMIGIGACLTGLGYDLRAFAPYGDYFEF